MESKTYNFTELAYFINVSRITEISYRGVPGDSVVDAHIIKNFWSFYYVDRGMVLFQMEDGRSFEVESGSGIFFAPKNNFKVSKTGDKDSNILSVFFVCDDLSVNFFNERIVNFGTFERSILSDLVNIS